MEPREAAALPVPVFADLQAAWKRLQPANKTLDRLLADGRWGEVVARVDEVLLHEVMGLAKGQVDQLRGAAKTLRSRRMTRSQPETSGD